MFYRLWLKDLIQRYERLPKSIISNCLFLNLFYLTFFLKSIENTGFSVRKVP